MSIPGHLMGGGINSNAISVTADNTSGSITYYPQTILSTGNMWTQAEVTQAIPVADAVAMMADGHVLVTAGFGKMKIPVKLFKDLVGLATMGLLEKLVPEEANDAK